MQSFTNAHPVSIVFYRIFTSLYKIGQSFIIRHPLIYISFKENIMGHSVKLLGWGFFLTLWLGHKTPVPMANQEMYFLVKKSNEHDG